MKIVLYCLNMGLLMFKKYNELNIDNIIYDIKKDHKQVEYINLACSFDIETTSTYVEDEQKFAFIYLWCFCIEDVKYSCYGRTLEEFKKLCEQLKKHFNLKDNRRLICYVHNLSYEFQFMRKHFDWDIGFSLDTRKPLKIRNDLHIEFRCSYMLSNYSLENVAKIELNNSIQKLNTNFNYDLIRHEKTKLTKSELQYCFNDVYILVTYINKVKKEFNNNITKIPLTNTGRVRKHMRKTCLYKNNKPDYKYKNVMEQLTLDKLEYVLLKDAFQGGFTHANGNYVNKKIKNVTSIDINSSYPSVLLTEQYPMGKGKFIDLKKEDFKKYLKNYLVVFEVEFINNN